jgi:1-deoxy-D-xylulose-5-phosphate reductoisomerase
LPKRIAILGCTGSIGCNALEVIEALGPDYQAVALAGHRNTDKVIEQARRHRPAAVVIAPEAATPAVVSRLKETGAAVMTGPDALVEIATRPDVDIVLAAVVGAAGLPAVLAAVRSGKTLALANKESLVVAGSLVMGEARRRGVAVLPVDSEHSAIFQALLCGSPGGAGFPACGDELSGRVGIAHPTLPLPHFPNNYRRIILTASGGPFRTATKDQIERATLADALNHPTWRMGNKITIDSATMFNKALEIIEARWLFDAPAEKIEVVVHPESVVHSMVEFADGSVVAQLSPPDMRTPIQYALTYPQRSPGISRRLDLTKAFSLNFEPPDFERFPALRLAFDVVSRGGTLGAVLNAANEVAVDAFVAGKIAFGEISRLVEFTIDSHRVQTDPSLDDLLEADRFSRELVRERIGQSAGRK